MSQDLQARYNPGRATSRRPTRSSTPSKLVKSNAKAKFDETIEIAINLGVDPRHADQQVRGVVNLPSGTGRDVRVAVLRPRRQRRGGHWPPEPRWWAPKTWSKRSRAASWTSTG